MSPIPNHVTNILRVSPEVADALITVSEDGERVVDFNRILPMPEEVRYTTVGSNGYGLDDERGWYGWARTNWGTKWNAYDTAIEPVPGDLVLVRFDTAWSHPLPVVEALSRKFPDEQVKALWADEDLGYNVGAYEMRNGQMLQVSHLGQGSPEAYEVACQIKYDMSYAEYRAQWGDE